MRLSRFSSITSPIDGGSTTVAAPPTGPGSILFPGEPAHAVTPSSTDWAMGSTWTIEFWIYASSFGAERIISQIDDINSIDVLTFGAGAIMACNGQLFTTSILPTNTWTHVAIVVSAGTGAIYYDGIAQSLLSDGGGAINLTNTVDSLNLGSANDQLPEYFTGKLTNLRITSGVAVYTGDFTVPTNHLTAIQSSDTNVSAISAGECLLLLNVSLSNSFLRDTSGYARPFINNQLAYSPDYPPGLV